MTTATGATIDYAYDELKRLDTTTVKLAGSSSALYTTDYDYLTNNGKATPLVGIHAVQVGSTALVDYRYTYDNLGNITAIYEGSSPGRILFSYTYDSQNQLLSETHYTYSGTSTTATTNVYSYTYDTAGNILTEKKNGTTTKTYTYGNTGWRDLLTGFNGTTISYDGAGNPTSYTNGLCSYSMEWEEGRQLSYMAFEDEYGQYQTAYYYDVDGIRTRKAVDSVIHNYVTQNGKVVRETIGSGTSAKILDFIYDESGKPFALKYSTNGGSSFGKYYYVLNLQGDVVKLVNTSGTVVANYTYNAWGEVLTATGNMAAINPLRYRGYYYDTETGFYYLQSRYYDPVTHRFINADSYTTTDSTDSISCNMFAYCGNNPVLNADPTGEIAVTTIILIGAIVVGVGTAIYTGCKARKAGCDWADTTFYAVGSGLSAFVSVYSIGMSLYGVYCNFCAINGLTPVTEIGSSSNIPQEAYDTYNYVQNHNGTPPTGQKGGRTFNNDGRDGSQLLPSSSAPYREYDIHPKVNGMSRGAERIVVGADAKAWYTPDHYRTFFEMEVK